MSDPAVRAYVQSVRSTFATGKASEHSYRPALQTLLESPGGLKAINEPKRAGYTGFAPDFVVRRGEIPIGLVEAKDVPIRLDGLTGHDRKQLDLYLKSSPNFIQTNHLLFRHFVSGEVREEVEIGRLKGGSLSFAENAYDDLAAFLRNYAHVTAPTLASPRELATTMADMAQQIAALIRASMADSDPLKTELAAFSQTLIPDLTGDQFADMYAQTLAYGLFAARVNHTGKSTAFTLNNAFWDLPATNPFLRRFFQTIAPEMDGRVRWQVEILTDLLAHADIDSILRDFGRKTRQEDPVVHFYETFLSEYNPALREQRGVYYTPEPVVSYIVRSVDHLLREQFNRPDGLADPRTFILDPATGTGTFLYFVIEEIHAALTGKNQAGMWNEYVTDKLLPRLFGFELLMAPYAVAHMKLGIQLHDLGYDLSSGQRLGVFLTNTLEQATAAEEHLAAFISSEAREADAIKRDKPIMVVLGNPPYSGHSANKGQWIKDRVRDYYFVDGQPLGERNPKWLQNDYVKFIRFGQWRIDETGLGVLAFITDNGYLDNPTFRGMRQHLLSTFDDIYILNLHGNRRKREKAHDGSPDENVFDIQQGVAIGIFVKRPLSPIVGAVREPPAARVHYADLWGKRENKYRLLLEHDLADTDWQDVEPTTPFYLFTPQNVDLREEFEEAISVAKIHPIYSMGITSGDDHRLVAFGREELQDQFPDSSKVINIDYRPFDVRNLYYDVDLLARARNDFMQHLSHPSNYALNTLRRPRNEYVGNFFVTTRPTDKCIISSLDNAHVFPLYTYPQPDAFRMFDISDWPPGPHGRTPNLSPDFVRDFEKQLGLTFVSDGRGDLETTFGPEDIFDYAYAVFHSPEYRARYAEFLKIDFPRLPLTSDCELFKALAGLGARLVDLHLLRVPVELITGFPVGGDNSVAAGYPKYDEGQQRVFINKAQYVSGVEPDVWAFKVGGYQVLDKWLKDRRGRTLTFDDVMHYQRVVAALSETMQIMEQIDEAIGGFPLP